jgi:competence protein ComGC
MDRQARPFIKKTNRFTALELLIVVIIFGTLFLMIVPFGMSRAPTKVKHSLCKSNLKQIGMSVCSYYEDSNVLLPMKPNSLVKQGGIFQIDKEVILCPTENKYPYMWLSGQVKFTGNADSPMAGDSVKHKKLASEYKVYQDGHVQ